MTILVCGEALYDVFFDGERPEGFTLDARIGGSCFNVAVGVARLGARVGLLTGMSRDRLGEKLVSTLDAEGVDTGFLARKDATTTLAMVSLQADGSAQYQFYGEGAADRAVTLADLPPVNVFDVAVFGCFSLLTVPTGDSFLTLAGRAAEAGKLVALDPNVRPTVEPDADVWRSRVDAFAQHADIIKVSAEDLAFLYPGETVEARAAAWRDGGTAVVVVTNGGDGVRLFAAGVDVTVAADKVAVVDTVGAGDSFLAALLVHLVDAGKANSAALGALTADDAREALAFATHAAAVTCGRRGADLPRRSDLSSVI
ncbi:carbohydrate kinase [Acuticoccus sp. MNP-M23]|uniref:carbohydrate kinase family protein n=1 Tax=Acuticoccus sp. MNP-M23 TaxID=3072793 RepID=UPI00281575D7|nr:carbohydrate kinase [Acuticoccus sp. MNP-M23]WMS41643.1 carbohydrate kinase [Acuticoccus sp. MNP-M23]